MAPCKRQLKATRHLICGSCSNWVDFVKSGCEKSWAEVQADSFSFECRGCTKMKELEVELEELRLLVVAMVGREQGGCASSSGGGTVDDKVGKDTRDARESSPQPGRKLRGGKVTGRRETGRKETGRKGTGGKTTGAKERGVGETGGKEKGVGETGGKEKGVGEMGGKTTGVKEREVGETRAKEWEVGETGAKETGGKGSGQNVMEGIEQILPVMGRRGHKYRNCRGMAINMLVQKLCREEEVGFVDLWGSFVGRADMYMKDGLHLTGKGAAVFADKLSAAVDIDLGTMTNIFGSKHSLN